jgi:hypothetical protein
LVCVSLFVVYMISHLSAIVNRFFWTFWKILVKYEHKKPLNWEYYTFRAVYQRPKKIILLFSWFCAIIIKVA